jgi:hypothetical protein
MSMFSIVREFSQFLLAHKKWLLIPVAIFLVLLGAMFFLGNDSALAPSREGVSPIRTWTPTGWSIGCSSEPLRESSSSRQRSSVLHSGRRCELPERSIRDIV